MALGARTGDVLSQILRSAFAGWAERSPLFGIVDAWVPAIRAARVDPAVALREG